MQSHSGNFPRTIEEIIGNAPCSANRDIRKIGRRVPPPVEGGDRPSAMPHFLPAALLKRASPFGSLGFALDGFLHTAVAW